LAGQIVFVTKPSKGPSGADSAITGSTSVFHVSPSMSQIHDQDRCSSRLAKSSGATRVSWTSASLWTPASPSDRGRLREPIGRIVGRSVHTGAERPEQAARVVVGIVAARADHEQLP